MRQRSRRRRHCIAALLIAAVASPLAAIEVIKQGGEFQVNLFTNNHQRFSAVAQNASGFVVVWTSVAQDGALEGVFGRRFASGGEPLGGEFQVNLSTLSFQYAPAVAMNAAGFVVVWNSYVDLTRQAEVMARRFDSSGGALGGEFQVNTYTLDRQNYADIGLDDSGFVVVWQSRYQDGGTYGVFGQRFDSSGARLGGEFQVAVITTPDQKAPAVARDATGFVVVWESPDNSASGVSARRFSSTGAPASGEFLLPVVTFGAQSHPDVARRASEFIAVWASDAQDGSGYGVFARRFGSAGAAVGAEFQVNTRTVNDQQNPTVGTVGSRFVVTWQSSNQDGEFLGVFGQVFDSSGLAQAVEFQINTVSSGNQYFPDVAGSGSSFVVSWQGDNGASASETFAQRFFLQADFDVDGNGSVDPLTDTLLALRYAFGFRGATLINGAVGPGCTRCDAASIEAYLAGKF